MVENHRPRCRRLAKAWLSHPNSGGGTVSVTASGIPAEWLCGGMDNIGKGFPDGSGEDQPASEAREDVRPVQVSPARPAPKTPTTLTPAPMAALEADAPFPPALAERCIRLGCPEGGVVLDTFSGSGSTGVAAVSYRRSYIGIDLDGGWEDRARKRILKAQ